MRNASGAIALLFFVASIGGASRARAAATSSAGTTGAGATAVATGKATTKSKAGGAAPATTTHRAPSEPAGKSAVTAPVPPVQKLPTVVITATRIAEPVSQVGTTVSVLNGEQIRRQEIQSVGDALRQVPGVEITQSGSPGTEVDASIRGSTPAETLVLIDGVAVNTGATGAFDLANLTTPDLQRIEVVRGAGGALYGSSAIGGVINLITQEGEGPARFSLLSSGGSSSTENQVATLAGANGRFHYSGAISHFSTTGYQPINDSSDNMTGALRLDYDLSEDTTLRAFARYGAANVGLVNLNVASGIPEDPNAHQRSEFMLYKGEIDHRFTRRLSLDASGYFVRNDLRLNDASSLASPGSSVDHIPDEIRGTTIEAHYRWPRDFRTVVGFDFKDRWVRSFAGSATPGFPPSNTLFRARRQEYAGYVEQEGSLLDGHLHFNGGFRADGNSEFGEELSPAWAVAIPLSKIGATLRGSYSEGFRAPSFDELFFPDFGNPALSPELSSEYDGGFTKAFGESLSFTATYFSRRVHDLIVTVPCATCLFGSEAGNAGRVDTQGFEAVPSIGPFKGVSLSGNFTFLDETHVSSSPTIRPTRVPKKAAFGLLRYIGHGLFSPHDRLVASLAYIFVGDRDDITPESTITSHDAYHRFDLVLSYAPGLAFEHLSDARVFVRVQNLLDRRYSEAFGFPSPPVNGVAGVKFDF